MENGTRRDQLYPLSIVYLVFLTPSVIGSFSVLVVSIVKWRHLTTQVHLLVQLALADLLAAVILMFTSAMNIDKTDIGGDFCQYSLPLSLTFYFISFLLVVVYAWKSKSSIKGWRARPAEDEGGQSQCQRNIVAIPVYAIVWLFPIAMYFVYVLTRLTITSMTTITDRSLHLVTGNESKSSCILFLHGGRDSHSSAGRVNEFISYCLFLGVILVLLSCSVIYFTVGKWYKQHETVGIFPVEGDGRSRRRMKRVVSTARNMVIVILFCWAPALVLMFTLMIHVDQEYLLSLYFIQAASVSLQGFLNSMVYAWRRPNFTEAVLGENTPLLRHKHRAFFEESLIHHSPPS
ncbi:uncharacterized protein si:dkey-30c15.2 [Scomber scombrus]|uniref:Uncharacterized protein si:dkey-30c15.2 n=1 Tax=Scomber scombrus TaxID=13677 RepID=A0AAV1PC60_SCOSC